MRVQEGSESSVIGDCGSEKKNPMINGKRMLGYKGEECVAMCEVLGFLREIEAERGHVIDSMTVVDSRLHTQ